MSSEKNDFNKILKEMSLKSALNRPYNQGGLKDTFFLIVEDSKDEELTDKDPYFFKHTYKWLPEDFERTKEVPNEAIKSYTAELAKPVGTTESWVKGSTNIFVTDNGRTATIYIVHPGASSNSFQAEYDPIEKTLFIKVYGRDAIYDLIDSNGKVYSPEKVTKLPESYKFNLNEYIMMDKNYISDMGIQGSETPMIYRNGILYISVYNPSLPCPQKTYYAPK